MYAVRGPIHASQGIENALGHGKTFVITENLSTRELLPGGYDWKLLYIYNNKILVVSQNGYPVAFDTGLDADNFIAQCAR